MRSIKRIISMILTIVMVLGMIPAQTVSAVSLNDLLGTENEVSEASTSNDDFTLQLEWADNTYKSETGMNINESKDVRNAVTLRVNYSCLDVRSEGYKAGDLIITVKGIGNVLRSGIQEALVGADKMNSGSKTHDWSYSWNRTNDTYTFINNKDIPARTVLSGYFELTWGLESRDCENGYSQNDISASLYLPDSQTLTTSSLSFSHNTTKDTFSLNITEQENMYGYQGLTQGISNPEDYAWVKYKIDTGVTRNARGAYNQKLVIDPDVNDIGSGAICLNPNLNIQDNKDGTYTIYGLSDSSQSFTLYAAYPKNQYATKTVQLKVQRIGDWYDESSKNSILAENSISKAIPGEFSFSEPPGYLYHMWLDKHFYDHSMHMGDIYGPSMQNNYSDYFYMNLTINANGNPYTAEMIADNFYITTKDDYRALNPDEYELTSVTIPSAQSILNLNGIPVESDSMTAEIYIAQNGTIIDPLGSTPYETVTINNSSSTIDLPANTTAVAVVLKNITDNIQTVSFTLKAKFNTKQADDNLDSGKLTPVAFIRLYDQTGEDTRFGTWINKATESNYTDTTDLHLAERDKNTYGTYLIRSKTEITFFGETPDYQRAIITANELKQVDRHYETTINVAGCFVYDYTNPPDDYTLYTILPAQYSLKGYVVPEDVYDIIKTSIPATSIDVDTDYRGTGLTYIAMHFNQPVDGTVSASIPVRTDRNDSVKVYAVLMNHVPVDANVGSQRDDGQWSDNPTLYSDLNQDNSLDNKLSYDSAIINKALAADSSELSINKYIQSQYSDGFTQSAPVEFNGEYTYQLSVRTGNGRASHVVITDILETTEGSEWHGYLKSVDLSLCEALGITGTVKYSTSTTPGDASSSSWSTDPDDITSARAVMIDFGDAVLERGTELNILIHMVAPNETALKNKTTYNTFHANFDLYDATRPGSEPIPQALDSSQTAASLTHSLETIVITKEDEIDKTRLKGAVFELYDTDDPELKIATATTNANGYAVFHYIPSDHTYILREVQAPSGYLPVEDQTIEVKAETLRLTIQDPRKPGAIEIFKTTSLTSSPLEGAEFAVFEKDTDKQVGESVFTDSQGAARIENLPWGVTYYLKEISAPNGYLVSDQTYEFTITRESVEQEPQRFRISNDQEPTKLAILKTDDQNQPLSGAILELVYQVNENSSFRYGLYVTDTNGRVDIEDLPYGSYILKEYRAPAGYEKFEEYQFTLQPDSPALDDDGYHTIAITVKDTRKTGSVIIVKNDDIGNQIADIEFTLYDQENHEVGKAVTDEAGIAKIENLEWGSYILKETNAPKYYQPNTEEYEIEITNTNLEVQLTIVNTTQKGSVVMTKYDETETDKLEGAVYSLYSAAGEYLGDYTTGADGTLTVENLAWGSYYFKEKKAPLGYGLSDETIRFSVNANNSTTVQELTATDKEITSSITVTKTIKADDINFANGNPTFIFCVKGQNQNYISYRAIVFDETYVQFNTDQDGMVSQSIIISELPSDIYEVSELNTSRYDIEQITNVVNGEVQGDKAIIDLTAGEPDSTGVVEIPTGAVEFINKNYEAQDFSHTDLRTNILSERQKLTSISVDYEDTSVKAGSSVDHDKLTVIANYDDGTSRTLNSNEYHLSQETFSTINGEYTIDVTFKDNGIERTGDFTIIISDGIDCIISLDATYTNTKDLNVGDAITPSMFTVKATTNTGKTRTLKTDEYLVLMPNTDTNAIAETALNDVRIVLNIDNGGYDVSTTVSDIPAIMPQPILQKGTDFRKNIKSDTTAVLFTNATWPDDAELIDVSAAQDNSVVAWYVGTTMYVRARNSNDPVIANKSCYAMFSYCRNLTELDLSNLNTSNVTNMGSMFDNCSRLKSLDLSEWDTSNVKDMSLMFDYCSGLTSLDVSEWDTSNVTNMTWMFSNCRNLTSIDVSKWDTSNVRTMNLMFYRCDDLTELDVSKWDTSSLDWADKMFDSCSKLTELDVSKWDTSNVTYMTSMFYRCSGLTELDVSEWDTSNVISMGSMFYGCSGLTSLDVSKWDTSNVTSMGNMFGSCSGLTSLDVSNFKTSNVTSMTQMFNYCPKLTELDVSKWDTSKVTNMSYMFSDCSGLTSLDVTNFDTSDVTSMSYMFTDCSGLTELDVSNFDTSKVTDMNYMFRGCSSLTELDLSSWDTSNVTRMDWMFNHCSGLTSLDLSNFKTSNLTDMDSMFYDCSSLTELDVSNFDTSKVTDMYNMFNGCSSLTKLDLSSWDMSNVTSVAQMFHRCYRVTTAYARTQADADKLNTPQWTTPSNIYFIVKPAA